MFLTASHELFARAIMETVNSLATATTGGNHDKDRQDEKSGGGHAGDSDKNFVHNRVKLATLYFHYITGDGKSQDRGAG